MTLEQLRIFLEVAAHLHFTRAAESLYLTQPAVSAAIRNLEAEYSVKLFHRIGRRIEMTDAGRMLQIEAQKILEQIVLAERNLLEFNNLQRGELKLGSSLTIGNYWLPDKISRFKQQYPGIQVNCTLGNAEEICEGTALGQFDVGLIAGAVKPAVQNLLDRDVVGSARLRILVGQTHPWFERPTIFVEDLTQTGWVMRELGSGAQQMLEQALQKWGIDLSQLQVVLVLSSSEMVKAVVERGIGAAALPELMVEKELKLGTLWAIQVIDRQHHSCNVLDIVQPIFKLKHKQRFPTQIIQAFECLLISNERWVEESACRYLK